MTVIGALAAAVAVTCAILASRRPSGVERRLRQVGPRRRELRPLARLIQHLVPSRPEDGADGERIAAAKVALAIGGALAGAAIAAVVGWGPLAPVGLAYAGLIAPSLVVERTEARARREAEGAVVSVVEWLHAIVASGRPVEGAFERIAGHASGSRLLDACLARVLRDYTLGVPLHVALARNGTESRVGGLVELAERIERSRDLGHGVLGSMQDFRDDLRARERAATLESASQVEGKLTLVLTLCCLPALALLVIVPLFLTLLSGLFGT